MRGGGAASEISLAAGGWRDECDLFNADQHADGVVNERTHFAYRLDVNEFRGRRSAYWVVEHGLPGFCVSLSSLSFPSTSPRNLFYLCGKS